MTFLSGRVLIAALLLLAVSGRAEEKSVSPYIDEIKGEMKAKEAESGKKTDSESYTEKIKRQLKQKDEQKAKETGEPSDKSYIEQLKEEDPELQKKKPEGYIESEKAKIPDQKEGGAIEAVNRGDSELHPKKRGEIKGAFGFKLGAASNRNITAGDLEARPFGQVYEGWAPEAQFYYEWQPWHSEFWGNVGIMGSLGVSYFNGFGKFKFALPKGCKSTSAPCSQTDFFPEDSETRFVFWEVPVFVGLDYRMNLLKVIRPFVMAGPMGIVYFESRDDDRPGSKGLSKALYLSAGVSILLDWLSSRSSWDLYMEHGIQHYYLTLDYSKTTTISSAVNFDVSAFNIGVAFEF